MYLSGYQMRPIPFLHEMYFLRYLGLLILSKSPPSLRYALSLYRIVLASALDTFFSVWIAKIFLFYLFLTVCNCSVMISTVMTFNDIRCTRTYSMFLGTLHTYWCGDNASLFGMIVFPNIFFCIAWVLVYTCLPLFWLAHLRSKCMRGWFLNRSSRHRELLSTLGSQAILFFLRSWLETPLALFWNMRNCHCSDYIHILIFSLYWIAHVLQKRKLPRLTRYNHILFRHQ